MFIAFAVFVSQIYSGAEVDPAALDQAIGVTSWFSWVVNLLIVEWWLHRHPAPSTQQSAKIQPHQDAWKSAGD